MMEKLNKKFIIVEMALDMSEITLKNIERIGTVEELAILEKWFNESRPLTLTPFKNENDYVPIIIDDEIAEKHKSNEYENNDRTGIT